MNDQSEKTVELNAQFATMHPVRDSLPVHLANGATFTQVSVNCKNCRGEIPQFDIKGTVRQAVANSYVIDALAYCEYCNLLTPFNCHIVPDGDRFLMISQHRHPFDDKGAVLKFARKP